MNLFQKKLLDIKNAYKVIDDILNDDNLCLDEDTEKEFKRTNENLKIIYGGYYNDFVNENGEDILKVDNCCKECNVNLLISEDIDFSYECPNCNEIYKDIDDDKVNQIEI